MKPSHSAYRVVFLCLVAMHLAMECHAQSLPSEVTKVIDQHCVACHDAETKEGNLDLLSLAKQPVTPDSLETWIKAHDRVRTGEMPPVGEPRLDESSLTRFVTSVAEQVIETERRMLAETGRSIKRRLNRYEYENSIRDLLSLPYLEIKDSLPEDRAAHGYNKTGEALDVSRVQLARYLRTAESALREAVIRQVEKPEQFRRRYYTWDQLKFTRGNGPAIRKTYPVLGYVLRNDLNVRPAGAPGKFIRPLPGDHSDPARRDEEAVVNVMSTYEHVEIQFDEFRAPFSGRYRLSFAGYTVWMAPDYSQVTKGRRAEPITIYADTPPRILRRLGHFDFEPECSVQEIEVWLKEGETIRPDASRLVRSRPPHFRNPLLEEDGMPGVAYQWMEVRSLSWTESGVMIPCDQSAAETFKRMFLQGTAEETQEQVRKLELGQSILDTVAGQAKSLERGLGRSDKQRLEQYYGSVRDLEKRIEASKAWEFRPKPRIHMPVPLDPKDPSDYMEKVRLMYEISRLAFQTDSTRVISLMLDSVNSPAIEVDGKTVSDGYHNLSHHGRSEEKLKQLEVIDKWHMKLLAELLDGLNTFEEEGEPLLERTMVFYGSNLGNAHAHTCLNLPTLFAGGGFRHGQHLAFDTQRNYPLPNLFVSMLQRMDIETDKFASSTGTMRGLEFTG